MNNHDPYHPDNIEDTTPELEQEYLDASGVDAEEPDYPEYQTCEHGVYKGYIGGYCTKCDEYEKQRGGLDQCMRCGRYCCGDELDKDQCHIKPCKNPAEY